MALGKHRVPEIESGEFGLARARRHRQVVEEPLVEWTMVRELQRAERVRDMFDRVGLAMRKIVGRVNAPLRAGSRVRCMQYGIQHGVEQVYVVALSVDLR